MRVFRIIMLLLPFGAAGVALSGIRAEQTRSIARIQQHRLQQQSLITALHERQLRAARLRAPATITRRLAQWDIDPNLEWRPDPSKQLALGPEGNE